MSEKLPEFANINFDGERVGATRENVIIYTHLGRHALYDHVFITHPNGEYGAYVWAQHPPENPNYIQLALAAEEHQAEMHLNIQEPSPKDVEAFIKVTTRDLEEFKIPEDWK